MNYHTFLFYGIWVILLGGALFCAVQISVTDWRRRIIPDAFLWPLMLVGLLLAAYNPTYPVAPRDAALGGAFGYALASILGFVFDSKIRRHNLEATAPIGMGDIKLIATGGIWLGLSGLAIALIIAGVTGAAWGWRTHQKYIPFAPFFIAGGILSLIGLLFLL